MKKVWIVSGTIVVCAGLALLVISRMQRQKVQPGVGGVDASASAASQDTMPVTAKNAGQKPIKPVSIDSASAESTNTNTDSKLVAKGVKPIEPVDFSKEVRALNDALDDDNIELALKEARRLMKHPDADVRSQVAFALSWIGVKGLSELTAMLTDPDPEVASAAFDYWKGGLDEINSDLDKAAMIGSAAQLFGETMSDDVLFDLVMECNMLDDEVALPQLATILQTVTKPEHKEQVIEAIQQTMSETDTPADDEAGLLAQIPLELQAREKIKAEEKALGTASSTKTSGSTKTKSKLPGLVR